MNKLFIIVGVACFALAMNLSASCLFADCPQVVMDSNGTAVSIWQQPCGGYQEIQSSIKISGREWSAPIALSPPGINCLNPQIVMNEHGHAIAVWSQVDNHNRTSSLHAAMLIHGDKWGEVEQISSSEELATAHYKVSMNQNGEVIVVWTAHPSIAQCNRVVMRSATAFFGGQWTKPSPLYD